MHFLPPYSPEHNPDEYLNNDLKQQLKNLPRPDTHDDLVQATSSVLRSLQRKPHRIRAYFHHKDVRFAASHRALILNYFRAKKQFSSGIVEGLNNKAKLTIRKSYGFRTFHVTEIALYHALGKLPEPDVGHKFF